MKYKIGDLMLVQTGGYVPGLTWIIGEETFKERNVYVKKYRDVLKDDQIYSYEACLENPKLESKRYYRLKTLESIVWVRKSWKESQLPESTKMQRRFLKKNN